MTQPSRRICEKILSIWKKWDEDEKSPQGQTSPQRFSGIDESKTSKRSISWSQFVPRVCSRTMVWVDNERWLQDWHGTLSWKIECGDSNACRLTSVRVANLSRTQLAYNIWNKTGCWAGKSSWRTCAHTQRGKAINQANYCSRQVKGASSLWI